MNTTNPSKNLPNAASVQIRRCIAVMGVDFKEVPSAHTGNSSIYSCTVLAVLTPGFARLFSGVVADVISVSTLHLDKYQLYKLPDGRPSAMAV
jgi:hypothetical protein